MVQQNQTRRSVVKVGALSLAAPALAGCGGSSDDDGSGGEPNGGGGEPNEGDSQAGTPSVDRWFSGTSNYDGVKDKTGSDEVTVKVGAGDNGLLFSPPAIKVDPATTIIWEWTGKGGSHNVKHKNGLFESQLTDEEGHTFEWSAKSIDNPQGLNPDMFYFCEPHKQAGMRGLLRYNL